MNKGFTMVELLVAFTMFAVVISMVSSIFITSYRSQRAIVELTTANDNTYLALEQLARDVRDGRNFCFVGSCFVGFNCPPPNRFMFTHRSGDKVCYRRGIDAGRGFLERRSGGIDGSVTAGNIDIKSLKITPNCGPDPVRITLNLELGVVGLPAVEGIINKIQTTVATRNLATCLN